MLFLLVLHDVQLLPDSFHLPSAFLFCFPLPGVTRVTTSLFLFSGISAVEHFRNRSITSVTIGMCLIGAALCG